MAVSKLHENLDQNFWQASLAYTREQIYSPKFRALGGVSLRRPIPLCLSEGNMTGDCFTEIGPTLGTLASYSIGFV